MGLGNMFSKLFKKENGKDSSAVTEEGERNNTIDLANKTESSRTENIHKLQTRNIEETLPQATQSEGKGEDIQTEEGDCQELQTEAAIPGEEAVTEEKVMEILSDIYDPEIPVDIVNLGLIYGVDIENGSVNVKMTLTSPGCPTAGQMVQEAQMLIEELPGVKEAKVEVVWDPPWDPSKMSDEAKKALGYM
jgi:FeS assembly SUF system protein